MQDTPSIEQINRHLSEGRIQEAADLIKAGLARRINFQGMHVNYAHVLLASAPWLEITALLPPETNSLLTSGWIRSVLCGMPVDSGGDPIPWLTYPAIEFLEGRLKSDWRVFEWGSGNSTLWWSRRCASVTAVEQNAGWFAKVSARLPDNAEIVLREDKTTYVDAVSQSDPFDVIVIDGEYRNECAYACIERLKPGGLIVFDNSDRSGYDESIMFLESQSFHRLDFWGMIPSYLYRNCTSIFFRGIESLQIATVPSKHRSDLGLSCEQAVERYSDRSEP